MNNLKSGQREAFQNRRNAKAKQDLLAELAPSIDAAAETERVGATFKLETDPELLREFQALPVKVAKSVSRPPVSEPTERKPDPNRKTIRLHPDVRKAIEDYALEQRRGFSDVLKEVLIAGMKDKGISL